MTLRGGCDTGPRPTLPVHLFVERLFAEHLFAERLFGERLFV